ncbi:uncharacterized protein LOC112097858 [Citrus clementina]|uniref:uncharacterized protein LOC112097858 n=1 Tax=Citrus clementina TaxID=85681 RepID=UPI000CED51E9|nr:uncharacterized protein LOC112097858 [Citrus x clementina]
MPNYVKFLKDILVRKRKLGEFETECQESRTLLEKIRRVRPAKQNKGLYNGRALCDLGVNINLMPLSVFKQLRVGECRPTTVTLQLADRSHAYPEGKIEDVLMKKGELTMKVNDQQVTFNVLEAMKSPDEIEDCNFISVIDLIVTERIDKCYSKEVIKAATFESLEEEDVAAIYIAWLKEKQVERHHIHFKSLDLLNKEVKPRMPSIESPPTLGLKLLPSHLKYVYLGKNNKLPVIISSSLNANQERSPVDVLGKYKKVIDWTMVDTEGISPSIW